MNYRPFEELFEIPSRNGLTKPKRIRGEGYKMINMGELFKYPRMKNIPMDRVPLNDKELANSMVKSGDLLFARQSLVLEGAGQCSIFIVDDEEVCFESHLIRCRLNKNIANPLFYYYFFSSRFGKQAISAIVEQGAGAAGVRGSDLAKVLVPDVDMGIQNNITRIIDQIDNKIELNRQTNQTLEQIAQTIFKSWFVDFDPVKAKIQAKENGQDPERAAMCAISGKTESELAQLTDEQLQKLKDTAALFPDALGESELGEVPEGWSVQSLDEIAHYQNGLALQKFRPADENDFLPVLKISQLKKGFADGEEKASSKINPECIVDDGDVVFSWSGSLVVDVWCGGKAALNQHLFKVTSIDYPKWFYYYWTKCHLESFQQVASDKAVTMGHIKRSHLAEAKCAVPNCDLEDFVMIATFLEKQIEQRLESTTLQGIRDSLLPKLLSGELSIKLDQLTEVVA